MFELLVYFFPIGLNSLQLQLDYINQNFISTF